MTLEKFIRLFLLSIFGGLCAGGIIYTTLVSLETPRSYQDYLTHMKTATLGSIITSITISISWLIMFLRKPATSNRAMKYGSLTGLFAFFIFVVTSIYKSAFPLETQTSIPVLILAFFFTFFLGFILGGFLAPLLGGFLGYLSVLGLEEK